MKPKPYKINGNWDVESSVFLVFYGKLKYVIIKGKKQIISLQALEKTIAAYIRGNDPNPDSMYYHLLLYVKKNPGKAFSVRTILESESGYELLKKEQELLDEARSDKHCLNNNTDAYVPQYRPETDTYGWLTKGDVLNFNNWSAKRPKPRKNRLKQSLV
jgi:hypothetical protein